MVRLLTSDNQEFEVDKDIIIRSVLIRNVLEDIGELDHCIPLPNISASVLTLVVDYCTHHRHEPLPNLEAHETRDEIRRRTLGLNEWDQKFFTVDPEMMFSLIHAANYLEIKQLLDGCCASVVNYAGGIWNESPDEIRKTFNIVDDFTPSELEQIKKEEQWSFDN